MKRDELENLYKNAVEELEKKDEVVEELEKKDEVIETMTVLSRVYLRTEPNQECDFVRILDTNEIIVVHEIVDGWAKVDEGFVMASFLK